MSNAFVWLGEGKINVMLNETVYKNKQCIVRFPAELLAPIVKHD